MPLCSFVWHQNSHAITEQGVGQLTLTLPSDVCITNTGSLQTAVSAWCSDSASAESNYGPIVSWDTSGVDSMHQLFRLDNGGHCSTGQSFNADVTGWDTARVTVMDQMFFGASDFDRDLSGWNISKVISMESILLGAPASSVPICGITWHQNSQSILERDAGRLTLSDVAGACWEDCPAGSELYNSQEGVCAPCTPGHFKVAGPRSCTPCPPGSFQALAGQSECFQVCLPVLLICESLGYIYILVSL